LVEPGLALSRELTWMKEALDPSCDSAVWLAIKCAAGVLLHVMVVAVTATLRWSTISMLVRETDGCYVLVICCCATGKQN
jgi:hypothetical protein